MFFRAAGQPAAPLQIHPPVGQKGDALRLQQTPLLPLAAKGEAAAERPVAKDDAVAGDDATRPRGICFTTS